MYGKGKVKQYGTLEKAEEFKQCTYTRSQVHTILRFRVHTRHHWISGKTRFLSKAKTKLKSDGASEWEKGEGVNIATELYQIRGIVRRGGTGTRN